MSIAPPPRNLAQAGRLRPEAAPTPPQAPQNLTSSNQGKWVDLSFKVTEAERDDFRIEAALRKMSHKDLLKAALQLYREHYPVPGR